MRLITSIRKPAARAIATAAIAVWKGHVRQYYAKAAKLALAGIVAGFGKSHVAAAPICGHYRGPRR